MKVDKSVEIAALLEVIEEYGPIVRQAVPIVQSMASDSKPLMDSFCDFIVDSTHRMIVRYETLGYSKAEAIEMVRWNKQTLYEANKSYNQNKK